MSIVSVVLWPIVDVVEDKDDHDADEDREAQRAHHDEETSDYSNLSRRRDLQCFCLILNGLDILQFCVRDYIDGIFETHIDGIC